MIVQLFIFFSIFHRPVMGLQASDFYVHDLPLLPKEASPIRMHAGHIPVDPQYRGALFFWHFASENVADKSRTLIWLNGGPGCSSLIGAWMEIGPFRFRDMNTMVINDGSWHLYTNLLFVDQPVGTGFSYINTGSLIHELDEMTDQFLGFLDRYIEVFPELLQHDIYLAGESFAGQYIPYVAQGILEKRSLLKLRGLLIGNGWIDPATTYQSYLSFAVAHNLVKKYSVLYNRIEAEVKRCQDALANQMHVLEEACDPIFGQILKNGAMNNHHGENQIGRCVNVYDVRLDDTYPDCGMNWPPNLKYVTSYLQRQDVMSCIHVDSKKTRWTECSESIFTTFRACHSTPSIKLLPDLLRQIPIVLYSGDYDLICNHWATEKMLDTMTWNNGTGFDLGNGTSTPKRLWTVEDELAGLIQSARNMTYILFYNASHMVPYNQARRSRAMLHKFMQLNLTSFHDQTTKKNTATTDQITHHAAKRAGFITLAAIISIIVVIGFIWLIVYKRQQIGIPTVFNNIRLLLLKKRDDGRRQLVVYSVLNDTNEDVYESDDETAV